jgi:hypothetical protein
MRLGVASHFLTGPAIGGAPVQISITTSHFRLPSNPSRAIIVCGPDAGSRRCVRSCRNARPGAGTARPGCSAAASTRRRIFCNRDELLAWRKTGTLSRLDTAFSRDQANKIYVQDRMLENAADLWRWLQDGAYFYVCGDALRMAKDVDAALPGRRRCFRAGRTLLVYHAYIQNGRLCMGSAYRVV